LEIKANAAIRNDTTLNEVVDECLKVKRQQKFLDPEGVNLPKALDVIHYKRLIATMAMRGVFDTSMANTVKAEIMAIC